MLMNKQVAAAIITRGIDDVVERRSEVRLRDRMIVLQTKTSSGQVILAIVGGS
jgi:hypothetical protein